MTSSGTSSCGWFVLNNHIILESIIAHLLELRDITALACVSNSVSFHIKHVFPFAARKLSFRAIPSSTDETVLGLLDAHLRDGRGSRPRKDLKADGGTIVIGGGAPGAPFTGSWRNLQHVDLSGTNISTRTVIVLLTATCGCMVSDMRPPFKKEWGFLIVGDPVGASLAKDQGLRLKTLSIQNCRKVWIPELVTYLRSVLTATTRAARLRMNQAQMAANVGNGNNATVAAVAVNNLNLPPPFAGANNALAMNAAGAGVGQNNHNGNGNGHGHGHNNGNNNGRTPLTEALQNLGLSDDDIQAIHGPLPNCAAELKQFGLPVFSLRKLDVAGAGGMGLRSAGDPVAFRSLASLGTVAGCLGIELDVVFCQGANCAYGIKVDIADEDFTGQHHRDTYKRPLPHMPGERIFTDESGRMFRIPKHCIRERNPASAPQSQPQVPPLAQNLPTAPPPPSANAVTGPVPGANPVIPPAQQPNAYMLNLSQSVITGIPHAPPVSALPSQAQAYQLPLVTATGGQLVPLTHPPIPSHPPTLVPPPSHSPPAFYQPQAPNLREILPQPSNEDRSPRRRIAMEGGPRGICETCGREIWVCEGCNNFWVLYCGGCAAKGIRNADADPTVSDNDGL